MDLSKEMIAVAKKKCSSFSEVYFKESTFEAAKFSKESFDLVVSGMAWHWVTPEGRYEKVQKILKRNGTLALFWYHQLSEKSPFLKDAGFIPIVVMLGIFFCCFGLGAWNFFTQPPTPDCLFF